MGKNVEYEYISKGSPVIMTELINGKPCAQYTAYIDRGCNNWKLYPRRLLNKSSISFARKTVPVSQVRILPDPDFIFPMPEPTEEEKIKLTEKKLTGGYKFNPTKGQQLSIFEVKNEKNR